MAVVGLLVILVFVFGLAIYFYCVRFTKASVGEVGRIMFFCGLLAYLFSSSAQNCSFGPNGCGSSGGGSGGSAQHR